MNAITFSLAVAVIVEAVMEYIKSGYTAIVDKKYGKILYYGAAFGLCLLLCFWGQADIFSALGLSLGPKWVGIVLTALFASRGASYLRSILAKLEL